MTIEEMKALKKELGLTTEMLSERSGVPVGTLQKIFGGATKAPRKLTIDAIQKALRAAEDESSSPRSVSIGPEGETLFRASGPEGVFCEAPAGYCLAGKEMGTPEKEDRWEKRVFPEAEKQQKKRYTIKDYAALPEERRVELIDGKFYDMTAPSDRHQSILGDLHLLFRECIVEHDMPCDVTFAPYDVRLDRDEYTMVQPDLVVSFRKEEGETTPYYEGAPDLIVEVLSPSTRSKDMILKLYKYQNAGVREYWIVDPKRMTVSVHSFEEEEYEPKLYDFDAQIPVNISAGKCSIDFSRVGRMPGARWRRP